MTQRYWNCGELPEALQSAIADFVEENVKEAVTGNWEDIAPSCFFAALDKKAKIEFYSPEYEDREGNPISHKYEYDLLEEIQSWARDIWGMEDAKAQRNIAFIRKLASEIDSIADEIEAGRKVAGE